jgi:hypothetical protein
MRKTRLSALTAATILAVAMLADRAAAMPFAAPAGGSLAIENAAIVCGGNGCAPVETKPRQHKKFMPLGYTKPLGQTTTPAPPAPAAPAATTLTSILQKL